MILPTQVPWWLVPEGDRKWVCVCGRKLTTKGRATHRCKVQQNDGSEA